MKKVIVVLLTLLLIAALTVPALADGSVVFTVSPSKSSVALGETITFTVSVSSSTQVNNMGFTIAYDEKVFEIIDVTGGNIPDTMAKSFGKDLPGGPGGAVQFNKAQSYSGAFLTFKLKAKTNANGSKVGGVGRANFGDQKITSSVNGATVTVAAPECKHDFGSWEKVDSKTHQRTCKICGKVEKHEHVYDNACDPDCNVCGAKRDVKHQWQAKWTSDKSGHWHECAVCHEKTKVEPHKPGPEATEKNPQTCTVCGYEISPKVSHKHKYSNEWSYDGEGHWHVCTVWGCHSKVDYHEHVYDNECDVSCNVCGYLRKAPHVPNGEWRGDETGHWHVCTRCGEKVDLMPHDPGPEATDDSPQVCLTCGYIIKPATGNHTHSFEGDWQSDDHEHWHQCACGEKADVGAHEWDEGVVTKAPTQNADGEKTFTCKVCGKVKTEIIPKQDGTAETNAPAQSSSDAGNEGGNNSLWGIVAIVAVVLSVIGIGILVWLLLPMNKNRHGKFSS